MADDRDHEVLNALVRLMSNLDDPSGLTDEQLVEAIREAREIRRKALRSATIELQRRGWTARDIAGAVGVHFTQPGRWAKAKEDDGE